MEKGGDIMNCVKCGNPVAEGNNFCMICGTPVASAQAQTAPAPAPGPAQDAASIPPVEINPQPGAKPEPVEIPYAPPVMEGNNCIIPVGRSFRIRCPDCGHISDDIKRDTSAGYPCPVCKKTYAYGGQLLLYRMGSFHPLIMAVPYNIFIDGVDYGVTTNHSSLRIMLSSGPHIVCCGNMYKKTNQFQIVVSPEFNSFGFKFNIIYRPFGLPSDHGFPIELKSCAPQEVPYI